MAGIGDATMRKFLDPNYKFHANENWLRAQAEDKEKFDTGMSFIKNAKATANLARAAGYGAENVENAYEGPGQTIGAAGGPIPDYYQDPIIQTAKRNEDPGPRNNYQGL